jgi:multicomponent Na+:H+ antiporter subunit C
MELVLAIVVGSLFAAGLYTILRRSVVRLAVGLVMIGHAANLLIFTVAGLRRGQPPILEDYEAAEGGDAIANLVTDVAALPVADPLPQALVLTAIVIGFGVLAFTLVLVHRVYQVAGTDDVDALTTTDRLTEEEKKP